MENSAIVEQFLKGLKERLSEDDKLSLSYATGASPEQLARLKARYPDCPASLLQLLTHINGTYWQEYGAHTISVLMLGSDVFEYPYYLKSVEQILEQSNYGGDGTINEKYGEYLEEMPDLVQGAIDPNINTDLWLCFSDCMNNGGTSSLYIDFNPLPGGTPGQVVRFLHDPDSFKVIAPGFDEYLQMLIKDDYAFILPEE